MLKNKSSKSISLNCLILKLLNDLLVIIKQAKHRAKKFYKKHV